MRTIILILASLLLCNVNANAQANWQRIYDASVTAYHAVSEDTVYLVDGFDIKRITDGKRWTKIGSTPWLKDSFYVSEQISSHYKIREIHVVNPVTILLAVEAHYDTASGAPGLLQGLIFQSEDGARTWRKIEVSDGAGKPISPITSFHRISDSLVFGYGSSQYNSARFDFRMPASVCTFDGTSFNFGKLPGLELGSTAAVLGHEMMVTDSSGYVFVGKVGNEQWRKTNVRAVEIAYLDTNVAVTVGEQNMITTDNGITWSNLNVTQMGSIYGSSHGICWLTGEFLFLSVDSGKSWISRGEKSAYYDIVTASPKVTYSLGLLGRLFRYAEDTLTLGVRELGSTNRLTAFPNPGSNHIAFGEEVRWFDAIGIEYLPQTEFINHQPTYDVRSLPRGIYFVKGKHGATKVILQ